MGGFISAIRNRAFDGIIRYQLLRCAGDPETEWSKRPTERQSTN